MTEYILLWLKKRHYTTFIYIYIYINIIYINFNIYNTYRHTAIHVCTVYCTKQSTLYDILYNIICILTSCITYIFIQQYMYNSFKGNNKSVRIKCMCVLMVYKQATHTYTLRLVLLNFVYDTV